jgi:DNA-binding NarL/FixJ family response regulator
VRVVIAEDSALVREGIARVLAAHGIEVVAEVEEGEALVEAIERHRPDVSIVDVRLPPAFRDEGLRAAIAARGRMPDARVVILSQYVEPTYTAELLESGEGGIGYLLKDRVSDVRAFVEALTRVAAGGMALDPEIVSQLVGRRRPAAERLASLSHRELEVLALMAEGRSNSAIADALDVTTAAVEKHITSIFGKLGLPASEAHHRRVLAVLAYLGEG